jgi:hypothetical protein
MNWYLAKIVFRLMSASDSPIAQFDEHLTLIEAIDEEEAILKARIHGIREEAKSLADGSLLAKWEFVNVAEIQFIPRFQNGTELYSRVHETNEAHNYVNFIHHKAAELQMRLA